MLLRDYEEKMSMHEIHADQKNKATTMSYFLFMDSCELTYTRYKEIITLQYMKIHYEQNT
jgi:hypothetical protein